MILSRPFVVEMKDGSLKKLKKILDPNDNVANW